MGDNSGIEWTDATWNPVTGCDKVSQGCKNCYADVMAQRLQKMGLKGYERGFEVTVHPNRLSIPSKWTRPRRIFVNSMSDLFHESIPFNYVQRVFDVMEANPRHTFQVLTKRSRYLAHTFKGLRWPKNVWMGVSVENKDVLQRIRDLCKVPAAVRFLSLEPLLGPLPNLDLRGIDWVIVGGESGPKARAMDPGWVCEIRDQCILDNVPFFFKQWGGPNKKATGATLDGRTWKEFPGSLGPRIAGCP